MVYIMVILSYMTDSGIHITDADDDLMGFLSPGQTNMAQTFGYGIPIIDAVLMVFIFILTSNYKAL